jgi:hypothetical protein
VGNVLEIEVDSPTNSNWQFLPLGKTIRGRVDFHRAHQADVARLAKEFPRGIPGQRLILDLDAGEGRIVDPIHDDPDLCAKIKARKMALPPREETFAITKESAPTYQYWLKRAVDSGTARLLKGKLPEKIDGRVTKRFNIQETTTPQEARMDKLLTLLFAKLPAADRKAAEEFMSE